MRDQTQQLKITSRENQQNHRVSAVPVLDGNADGDGKVDNKLIDLNARPQRGQGSSNQVFTCAEFYLVLWSFSISTDCAF